MGKRALRSVLVATFSAVVALAVLGGPSATKSVDRADSKWPAAPVSMAPADTADTADSSGS
ncbi:hypothetical protein EF917_16205 [Streptomyces sp. WAC00469]|nr:hypothetical protein EF917_16205 [Streptomyces sp. WAC00469]